MAAFFAKGLWDRAESLEGTVAAYDRVRGLKDIVVVREPHSIETWPQPEIDCVRDRMVRFAVAGVQGRASVPGGPPWTSVKELAATTPDSWETSSRPRPASSGQERPPDAGAGNRRIVRQSIELHC